MPESLQGRPLGPDWRVAVHTPTELLLEHVDPKAGRRVGGALVVTLGALTVGLALALATPVDARLITWPLSALLFVVAALGLPTTLRHLQRARLGVRLRITRSEVEGWPVGTWALGPRKFYATDVAKLSLQTFPHPPLTLAMLELVLKNGTRLTGPEVAVATGEKHPLGPVEAAARHLLASVG
jgi:hypothetical protein